MNPKAHTAFQNIEYKELCIQEYLLKWKYDNNLCYGCSKDVETENELVTCSGFFEGNEIKRDNLSYSLVFGYSVSDMVRVAKEIRKWLKVRDKILEAVWKRIKETNRNFLTCSWPCVLKIV